MTKTDDLEGWDFQTFDWDFETFDWDFELVDWTFDLVDWDFDFGWGARDAHENTPDDTKTAPASGA